MKTRKGAQQKQKGDTKSQPPSIDAKKGGNKLTMHQSDKSGGKSQPGVERSIMDLSGPRAFELRPKKPERDEVPLPPRPPSVNSGRTAKASLIKRLAGKRI